MEFGVLNYFPEMRAGKTGLQLCYTYWEVPGIAVAHPQGHSQRGSSHSSERGVRDSGKMFQQEVNNE
jgi:hypothetical protein